MSGVSSVSETCATIGRLRDGPRQNYVFLPAKWGTDQSAENAKTSSVERPSLSNLGSVKFPGAAAPGGTYSPASRRYSDFTRASPGPYPWFCVFF